MHCGVCGTNSEEWIARFASRNRVYLDKLYFDENKTSYEEDDKGLYISGQKFAEIESMKSKDRCPRCGTKSI
jgi:hypothetical protein